MWGTRLEFAIFVNFLVITDNTPAFQAAPQPLRNATYPVITEGYMERDQHGTAGASKLAGQEFTRAQQP